MDISVLYDNIRNNLILLYIVRSFWYLYGHRGSHFEEKKQRKKAKKKSKEKKHMVNIYWLVGIFAGNIIRIIALWISFPKIPNAPFSSHKNTPISFVLSASDRVCSVTIKTGILRMMRVDCLTCQVYYLDNVQSIYYNDLRGIKCCSTKQTELIWVNRVRSKSQRHSYPKVLILN